MRQYTEARVVWGEQTVEGMYRGAVGIGLYEEAIYSLSKPPYNGGALGYKDMYNMVSF